MTSHWSCHGCRVEVATDEELVEGLTQHVMRENRRLKDVVKDKVLSGEMSEADGKARLCGVLSDAAGRIGDSRLWQADRMRRIAELTPLRQHVLASAVQAADLEYHARLSRYLLSGVSTEEALVELGHAHCGAKCFLQAREHARQAVESVLSRAEGREARGPERSGGTAEGMQGPVHSSQRATASGSREQVCARLGCLSGSAGRVSRTTVPTRVVRRSGLLPAHARRGRGRRRCWARRGLCAERPVLRRRATRTATLGRPCGA